MTALLVCDSDSIDPPASHAPTIALRDWLQGEWAVLLSHPEDFAPHPSTPHGFLARLADDFGRAGTKPLAVVQSRQQSTAGWLQHASADRSLIVLKGNESGRIIDFAARALALQLTRLKAPFVVILDELGRCRSTISYRPRCIDRLRSVPELLSLVAILRSGSACGAANTARAMRTCITP